MREELHAVQERCLREVIMLSVVESLSYSLYAFVLQCCHSGMGKPLLEGISYLMLKVMRLFEYRGTYAGFEPV